MECLYTEDDDKIFALDEPFEEMGSEAVEVPALKEEEFAKIIVLGEHVSFPNGMSLSFALRQVAKVFLMGIHLRPTELSILPIGFHVRPDLGGVVCTYTTKDLFGENLCPVEIRLLGFLALLFFSTSMSLFVVL
ncbi:hypothetical protein Tco_1053881 [Tanacetum coccineum]|uniref:Uncharacterized protein n=1 Tax=Tanacetum coccineum TaxID=301880 RepID=A0ABQ5GVM0_9ASTR